MSDALDYEINKELGESYLFMGELDKAKKYYSKASVNDKTQAAPYLGLATIAMQENQLNDAYTLYRKANSLKDDDKSLAGMALIEMETDRETEAFTHFCQALDKNNANMVAIFMLLQLGYSLERLEEVVPYMKKFLQVEPDKQDVRYSLAGSLVKLGRTEEAREELQKILQNDPENQNAKELLDQVLTA